MLGWWPGSRNLLDMGFVVSGTEPAEALVSEFSILIMLSWEAPAVPKCHQNFRHGRRPASWNDMSVRGARHGASLWLWLWRESCCFYSRKATSRAQCHKFLTCAISCLRPVV